MILWYHCLCLLKDVRFRNMYFLETALWFHTLPYNQNLYYSNIWHIDKWDTLCNGFFLNIFWILTELQMWCKRKGFDIVSASGMNCNRRVSMQQPAYLTSTSYTNFGVNICIFIVQNYVEFTFLFCKVYVIFAIWNCNEIIILLMSNDTFVIKRV
jgi:hypothetical protein